MSDPDDDLFEFLERSTPKSWTVRYRTPLSIASAVLAVVFASSLFAGVPFSLYVGAVGLGVVVVWTLVFNWLYRRGH
ncbi:hypothetical protein [Frondihabitans cladoniiphilus]|uniref:DUF3040 family protein n=1 Tax=Frondihabitans cladoniiphilus TaxID=715785 RepID=A0ABP8VSI7_9MICO